MPTPIDKDMVSVKLEEALGLVSRQDDNGHDGGTANDFLPVGDLGHQRTQAHPNGEEQIGKEIVAKDGGQKMR
jgi:hypothetical protein